MLEFRNLRQEELENWFDHCMLVFNKGIVDYSYRQMLVDFWNNAPCHNYKGVRVAVEDGKILSGLRIIRYELYLTGESISMGGISSVGTIPDARGRGLSTRLLQEAIQLMETWEMKVSMLATGIPHFYKKLGWNQISFFNQTLRVAPTNEIAPICVRPLDFRRDLPAVEKIYREYSSQFNGTVVRNRKYWESAMKGAGYWWVAEIPQGDTTDAKVVACLRLIENQGQMQVTEFSAREPYENLFDPMVNEALRQKNQKIETITCPKLVHSAFKNLGVTEKDYLMLRLIHPFSVGAEQIESTDQLIHQMQGADNPDPQTPVSKSATFVFWETDGF